MFRIGVASNPPVTPTRNKWTIEYAGESSDPFDGFVLHTFTDLKLTPVNSARLSNDPNDFFQNPLEFTFKPYTTIPPKMENAASGGLLRITAPAGFEFPQVTDPDGKQYCRSDMRTKDNTVVFRSHLDIKCEVDNKIVRVH